jgi:hypothetical protein
MKITADITLIEHSTAGNPDKGFKGQTIELHSESPTIRQGVDGRASIGHHPTKVAWYGGAVEDLAGITHVKIASQGRILINAALNTHFGPPKGFSGGVRFEVMSDT